MSVKILRKVLHASAISGLYWLLMTTHAFAQQPSKAIDDPNEQLKVKTGAPESAKDELSDEEFRKSEELAKTKAAAKQAAQDKKDREIYCAKYEGRFINFYDEIFKVEQCKRRRVESQKGQYEITRKGITITNVPANVIAVIPEGSVIDPSVAGGKARHCLDFEGHYVTYSNVDVYYVERCARRLFPDWETYQSHRSKSKDPAGEILGLSWEEYEELKPGKEIPSVIDREFAQMLKSAATVDIIPVDEACRGIEGRWVSYYSRLYRIENCRKREIHPDHFFREQLTKDIRVKEMTSEQWISLPEGKPWPAPSEVEMPKPDIRN